MLKPQLVSNLANGKVGGRELFLGFIYQFIVYMLLRAFASKGF